MAKLTASQLYGLNRAAGFSPAAAVTMTAVQLAESGGDDAALGDQSLQTNTWGPSFGFAQIRTMKGETGHGTDRDMNWLAGNDANQAKAAFDISHNGTDFTAWTEYTNGGFRQFMGQAEAAAAGGGTAVTPAGNGGPFPVWGPSWLPWNWPSNAGNSVVNQGLSGARTIAVEAAFLGLGIGLLYVGAVRTFAPQIRKTVRAGVKGAEIGAML